LLLAGQSISWIGNNFYEIAIMWLVYKTTGSTAAMAGVAAVSTIPQLIFAPFAGVVADRVNRRVLALTMDLCRGIVILILPTLALLHHLAAWQVYVVAFVLFSMFTFFIPARQAILPNIVPPEHLAAANGLFQAVLSVSLLVGFGLGGIIVGWIGVIPALYLDSISFAVSVLSLLLMRTSGRADEVAGASGHTNVWSEMAAGLHFIRSQPALLAVFAFIGGIGLFVGPLVILPAPFSNTVLHAGVRGYGFLEGSFMGGNLVGALAGSFTRKIRSVGLLLIVVILAAGALLVGMSFVSVLAVAMVIYAVVGAVTGSVEVPLMTLIQRSTPDEMRGRIMSLLMVINTAATPLSLAVSGVVIQQIGVAPMYRVVGALFVLTAALSVLSPLARVRSDDTPTDASPRPIDSRASIEAAS
jgi:MFS family permease